MLYLILTSANFLLMDSILKLVTTGNSLKIWQAENQKYNSKTPFSQHLFIRTFNLCYTFRCTVPCK
jgi:hypothetical protein